MLVAEKTHPVVLYARVSKITDERSTSVDDQLSDLRAWAEREGWPITGEFRDDGISASRYAKGKQRPGWIDAMRAVMSGQVRALLTWDFARASRSDEVTAALKAACAESAVKLGYGGTLRDPSTADGAFSVGLDGLVAARYSAELSEKMQRSTRSRAAEGRPHGRPAYGYRRVIDPNTGKVIGREPHPDQAPIVREIVRRLLARESADAIAKDLNTRQVPAPSGGKWTGGNLAQLSRRPFYAGYTVLKGRIVDDVRGEWKPLISEADHHRLVAMHTAPDRERFRNSTTVTHLLSGIAKCGRPECGGPMRVVAQSGHRPASYSCRTCHKLSRRQALVDEAVEALIVARLSQPDVLDAFTDADDEDVKAAADEAARLRAKLAEVRQAWDDDELTLVEYKDMRARLQPKIEAAEKRARPKNAPDAVLALAGADAEKRWRDASIGDRRTVLAALVEVTILPVGRGKRVGFDPSRDLRTTWKT